MVRRIEYRWVIIFACLVMILTSIPYILGYANSGTGWRFTGFVFGVEDGNSYIAKMLEGAFGNWLFRTPYTAYPQNGVLIFLPYILLGKLASQPGIHEQLVALFHLFRFTAGIFWIVMTYGFISLFIDNVGLRRLGTILAALGGGLGWILVILGKNQWLGSLPLDYYSPETFGFLEIFGLPHVALARALMFLVLIQYLLRVQKRESRDTDHLLGRVNWFPKTTSDWKYFGGVGLAGLLTSIAQPLTGIVVWMIIGIYLIFLLGRALWISAHQGGNPWPVFWFAFRDALWSGWLALPLVLYNVLFFQIDPFLKSWVAQSTIPSANPLHYLLAYGLLIPFAVIGVSKLMKRFPKSGWLLIGWVIVLPLIIYIPFSFQRRLIEGMWVALIILSLVNWDIPGQVNGIGNLKKSWYIYFGFLFPTTLFLLLGGCIVAVKPGLPVFRPTAEVDSFKYLAQHASKNDIVLTSYDTGNALPAWAPLRVVIGHGPESMKIDTLRGEVGNFYDGGMNDAEQKAFLDSFDVHFVFWGPNEVALGGWDPSQSPFLKSVFEEGTYQVYEYKKSN